MTEPIEPEPLPSDWEPPPPRKGAHAKPGKKSYSRELASAICHHVAGGLSLASVARLPHMPTIQVIYHWRTKHPEFDRALKSARFDQLESLAEEITTIADTERDHTRAKNRMEARRWLLSKLQPDRYGDSLKLDAKVDQKLTVSVDAELLAAIKEMLE